MWGNSPTKVIEFPLLVVLRATRSGIEGFKAESNRKKIVRGVEFVFGGLFGGEKKRFDENASSS